MLGIMDEVERTIAKRDKCNTKVEILSCLSYSTNESSIENSQN
jgi:hypothetical protein